MTAWYGLHREDALTAAALDLPEGSVCLFSAACTETAIKPAAAATNHLSFIFKTSRCDARKNHLLAFIGHISETRLTKPFEDSFPNVNTNLMQAGLTQLLCQFKAAHPHRHQKMQVIDLKAYLQSSEANSDRAWHTAP